MNDARRQLLHEAYKLLDVGLMVAAFMLAISLMGASGGSPGSSEIESASTWPPAAVTDGPSVGVPIEAPAAEVDADPPSDDSPAEAELPPEPEGPVVAEGEADSATVVPEDPAPRAEGATREERPGRPSTAVALGDDGMLARWVSYLPSGLVEQLDRLEAALLSEPDGAYRLLGFVLIAFTSIFAWYASFSSQGLYNSRRLDSPWREAVDVFRGGAFGCAMVVVLTTSLVKARLPRGEDDLLRFAVLFFVLATGTSVTFRLIIRSVLTRLRLRGRNLRGVLVVGTNHRALRFASSLEKKKSLGYYVVGFVDEHWDGIAGFKKGGGRLVARLEDLGSYLANNVVDEVVVALPVSSAYVHSSRIVSLCTEQGITVRFVSQIFDQRLAKGRLDVFDGEPMLSLEGTPDLGFPKLIKTLFDRMAGSFLLLCVSPLLLVVAIAIKLTSPDGPVLFVQRRVGLNKRMFDVYKFRTMVPDAEARLKEIEHLNQVAGPVFKIDKDPRLTPIGDFLRRSSIDELPQLINVVKGDMSLVGPRPLPERDYKGFDKDSHRRRLSVRPGITCTWQVSGRNSIPFEEWMKMDLEYIDDWSLWLDFKILLRTIPVVLGPLILRKAGEFMKVKSGAETGESEAGNEGPAMSETTADGPRSGAPKGSRSEAASAKPPRAGTALDSEAVVSSRGIE